MAFKAEKTMKQNNMDSVCWPRIWPCHRVTLPGGMAPSGSPNKTSPPTSLVPGGTGIYCTRKLPLYLLMLSIYLCNYICLNKSFSPECSRHSFLSGFCNCFQVGFTLIPIVRWNSKLILFQTAASLRSFSDFLSPPQDPCLSCINLLLMLLTLILHSALKLVLVTMSLHHNFKIPSFPFVFSLGNCRTVLSSASKILLWFQFV